MGSRIDRCHLRCRWSFGKSPFLYEDHHRNTIAIVRCGRSESKTKKSARHRVGGCCKKKGGEIVTGHLTTFVTVVGMNRVPTSTLLSPLPWQSSADSPGPMSQYTGLLSLPVPFSEHSLPTAATAQLSRLPIVPRLWASSSLGFRPRMLLPRTPLFSSSSPRLSS